jgi:hypothetical protein
MIVMKKAFGFIVQSKLSVVTSSGFYGITVASRYVQQQTISPLQL